MNERKYFINSKFDDGRKDIASSGGFPEWTESDRAASIARWRENEAEAESNRQKAREYYKEQEEKVAKYLETLRISELESSFDFDDIDTIIGAFEDKDYFEQLVCLEKAINCGRIKTEKIIELFLKAKENSTRLAIVESTKLIKDEEEKKSMSDTFFNYILTGKELEYRDLWNETEKNCLFENYFNKYIYFDFNEQRLIEKGVVDCAIILNSPETFGEEAEKKLLKLFEEVEQFDIDDDFDINSDQEFENNKETSEYEEFDFDDAQDDYEFNSNPEADALSTMYRRVILQSLANLGNRASIDYFVEFSRNDLWEHIVFKDELIELYEKADISYAAKKHLDLLKSDNRQVRKMAESLLFRLEFGRIGISKSGVKYLEKMYDLGEMNNSDYFVQRLTAKGDIGVFDDKRVLQKYFQLGDLSYDEKTIKPAILDFTYETLFRSKENESDEEREKREAYLREFKENYFGFYDDKFFQKTGVRFNNLDFKEQGWFLLCYKNADEIKREKLIDFARRFGEQGLVSFLSLEYNDNNGDKILEIDEKLDRRTVEKIFARYVKIQANAKKLEETMKNSQFLKNREMADDVKQKLRENIYDAVMSRATDILSTAYKIAQTGEAKANFYNGQEIRVKEIDEVIEAMDVYEDFLEKMKGFFAKDGRYQFEHASSNDQGDLSIHDFFVINKETNERSYCSISLRGNGTNEHLKNFEYDGEARINFLFNNEPILPDIQNKSRKEATTFRLDRECLTFDEPGQNVISKDNTQNAGKLSFDFGSIYEDSGRQNNVLARVISVGNFYSSREKEKKPEYYHNKESFYHDLGKADVFKQIAETVEDFIKSKYIEKKVFSPSRKEN